MDRRKSMDIIPVFFYYFKIMILAVHTFQESTFDHCHNHHPHRSTPDNGNNCKNKNWMGNGKKAKTPFMLLEFQSYLSVDRRWQYFPRGQSAFS